MTRDCSWTNLNNVGGSRVKNDGSSVKNKGSTESLTFSPALQIISMKTFRFSGNYNVMYNEISIRVYVKSSWHLQVLEALLKMDPESAFVKFMRACKLSFYSPA